MYGFKKGFLTKDSKSEKTDSRGEPSKTDTQSGKLSIRDQHIVYGGGDPNTWGKPIDLPASSEADKGELQGVNKSQISDLTKEFRQTGGNTSLKDAKIICLGEKHANNRHIELNIQLINITAKDGDIILIEGEPAHQECRQEDDPITRLISKKVRVFGWDNKELHQRSIGLIKRELGINKTLSQENLDEGNRERLLREVMQIHHQVDAMSAARSEELARVIEQRIAVIKENFPNFPEGESPKIFVLAGSAHFTKHASLKRYLGAQKYIAFEPTFTLSVEEENKLALQHYSASAEPPAKRQRTAQRSAVASSSHVPLDSPTLRHKSGH